MTKKIAGYLGKPASTMLEADPFKTWPVEKSFEEDLEEPEIHYVFPRHGLAMRCDRDDKISVIFLYSDKYNALTKACLRPRFLGAVDKCWSIWALHRRVAAESAIQSLATTERGIVLRSRGMQSTSNIGLILTA
jgi:hypothetical protein